MRKTDMTDMTGQAFQSAWNRIRRGYALQMRGQVGIYTFPAFFDFPGIAHGFSARTGGVSLGSLSSLNLSFTRPGEARETVMENYRIFCKAAGIPEESMVMDTYEHGVTVRPVSQKDRGCGWTREPLPFCDGLITNDPAVTLMTGHADCMAFYFYDPQKKAVGLAHAGWRGALGRIGKNVVQAMTAQYGTDPADVYAGVGPSICQTHFEVNRDVAEAFQTAFPGLPCVKDGNPGKAHVDLWMVAAMQFLEAGILPQHLSIMEACTYEDPLLYSHRRDRGDTGGMTAFLRLLPEAESVR